MLDTNKIPYQLHEYDVKDGVLDGVSVAEKCGEDPRFVYKTLVCVGSDKKHYVFVIPVSSKLDLKKAAKAVQVKSLAMLPQKELLPLTGYVHGGCSPLGMKKQFPTYFDASINEIEHIYVSGGMIGLQMEVAPEALIPLVNGNITSLTEEAL